MPNIEYKIEVSEEYKIKLRQIGASSNFRENIEPTLLNIENESRLYNKEDKTDGLLFYNKYFYSMSNLLFSLNAYLLAEFIDLHKEEPKEKWNYIYEKQNQRNTIVNLFAYLVLKKQTKDSTAHSLLSSLYVYENLYRNQIAHGWINIFKNIDYRKMEKSLVISSDTLPIIMNDCLNVDSKKLKQINTEDFDLLRKSAKELTINELHKILEPTTTVRIDVQNLMDMKIKELISPKNEVNIHTEKIVKSLKIQYEKCSLNHLISLIMKVVEKIEYTPNLKEILSKRVFKKE